MIPKIKSVSTLDNYQLHVIFDDTKEVIYDVTADIETLPNYHLLKNQKDLFSQVQLDASRTCVFWTNEIDLPSDTIYEYGKTLGK